ncbi:MAG: hypothetical protein OXR73_08530, partial [Myxococcales bacterium]|nr:hypothetical protein [Myxococcales bacterium]
MAVGTAKAAIGGMGGALVGLAVLLTAGCTLRPATETPRAARATAGQATAGQVEPGGSETQARPGLPCPSSWGRMRSADMTAGPSLAAYQHVSCDQLDLTNCGTMCARLPEMCVAGKPDCRSESGHP